MNIRPYDAETDFSEIRNWITDARTHALWCANRFAFPLDKAQLAQTLEQNGDLPFTATGEDGKPLGFFCRSYNEESKEAMLKFVAVSPEHRGKGFGQAMIRLAVQNAFSETAAKSVQLNVFTCNQKAIRCYQHAGFTARAVAENAFRFQDESWGRYNMVLRNA